MENNAKYGIGNGTNLVDELNLRVRPQLELIYGLLHGIGPGDHLDDIDLEHIEAVLFIALDTWRDLEKKEGAVREKGKERFRSITKDFPHLIGFNKEFGFDFIDNCAKIYETGGNPVKVLNDWLIEHAPA